MAVGESITGEGRGARAPPFRGGGQLRYKVLRHCPLAINESQRDRLLKFLFRLIKIFKTIPDGVVVMVTIMKGKRRQIVA